MGSGVPLGGSFRRPGVGRRRTGYATRGFPLVSLGVSECRFTSVTVDPFGSGLSPPLEATPLCRGSSGQDRDAGVGVHRGWKFIVVRLLYRWSDRTAPRETSLLARPTCDPTEEPPSP